MTGIAYALALGVTVFWGLLLSLSGVIWLAAARRTDDPPREGAAPNAHGDHHE